MTIELAGSFISDVSLAGSFISDVSLYAAFDGYMVGGNWWEFIDNLKDTAGGSEFDYVRESVAYNSAGVLVAANLPVFEL
jgi:hypothetical protein